MKKSLLIATPAYGGLVTTHYLGSMVETLMEVMKHKLVSRFSVYTQNNESLIPRGRDRCAEFALTQGFSHLLFIDADIGWTPSDFKLLLSSDKDIVGGTYPMKTFPITMNYNHLPETQTLGKLRSVDDHITYAKEYADSKGEVEVRHIPTGFMLINTKVFLDLIEREFVKPYYCWDASTQKMEKRWPFFPSGFQEDPRGNTYTSEDWGFCDLARSAGHKIYLQTKIICSHTGNWTFTPGQHVISGQNPLPSHGL